MGFAIIPVFLFYVIPIIFVVWAILTIIRQQRENNELLSEIIKKLNEK